MNFIKIIEDKSNTVCILNAAHVVSAFESYDDKLVRVNLINSDTALYVNKQRWNKAVREAGVPGLQFF